MSRGAPYLPKSFDFKDGKLWPNQRPGLGVEFDPSALTLLTEISEEGANVLEVAHERISPSLTLNEVEVRIQLETRGEAHADHLRARLRERGYRVDD